MRSLGGSRRLIRTVLGITSAVTVVAGSVIALGSPAGAATCSSEYVKDDLDDDGHADVVVGLPGFAGEVGAVDVRYTGRPSTVLRGSDLGGGTAPGIRFGAALVIGDLDQDGCEDLVVGAPGQDTSGRVYIVFGSPTGLDLGSTITVVHPGGIDADEFGAALAVSEERMIDEQNQTKSYQLIVGAPGSTVAGQADAGAVWRYLITPTAPGRVTVATGAQLTQNSPAVPGVAETGDRFGEHVAPTWRGGFVAAAPTEDVGPAVDAGAVWDVRATDSGDWPVARVISQDTAGVYGRAERGDRFGASIATDAYLVVGVPGEDAGSLRDTGLAQVFDYDQDDPDSVPRYEPLRTLHQDAAGVPGVAEAGDQFGAAVTIGRGLTCLDGGYEVAIGAPGEDVGSRTDAGSITLAAASPKQQCLGTPIATRVVRQGDGLQGAAEAGDRVGVTLSTSLGRIEDDDDPIGEQTHVARLLIGAPSEDVGTLQDVGAVLALRPSSGRSTITVDGRSVGALTFSGGRTAGTGYGVVLSRSFL